MLQERVLVRVSQILCAAVIVLLVYCHFFGWVGTKMKMVADTRAYLLASGVSETDIINIEAGYDFREENCYFTRATIDDSEEGVQTYLYFYDVEEKIYQQGEKY